MMDRMEHPKPQFERENWLNLNGTWQFEMDPGNSGEERGLFQPDAPFSREIRVPFCMESRLSGIGYTDFMPSVWYRRDVEISAEQLEQSVVLHFGAVDYETTVYINGQECGYHKGGYVSFSFEVSRFLTVGRNVITVHAVDDTRDRRIPSGKQSARYGSFGCFYTRTTGIWQTVWLEFVPQTHVEKVRYTVDEENGSVTIAATLSGSGTLQAEAYYEGEPMGSAQVCSSGGQAILTVKLKETHLWEVGQGRLYDLILTYGEDRVKSYFGLRSVRLEGYRFLLNGKSVFQRLILDQGYWKDSHLTPPDEDALIQDIDKIHALGYNGLRKHQKIEDERFLYWCDVKGMLVWSEAPAAYEYSDYAVEEFSREWMEIVKQNYNHPCIITWTPFNESWGVSQIHTSRREQHFTEMIYHLTKTIDPYRPVIVNDGWDHTVSDILTFHDYEESGAILKQRYLEYEKEILEGKMSYNNLKVAFAQGFSYWGQPVIISEFGGIAFNNDDSGWGYGNKVNTQEDFIRRFDEITTAVKELPYVCGYCYTQVSDVQQEINGLMDMERNFKVEP